MEGSIHEDTTTTDYDSGDSEGVSYAYESGRRPVMNPKPVVPKALAASPKRRTTKSRSPKGVRSQTQPQSHQPSVQAQAQVQVRPHCQCPCAAAVAAAVAAAAAAAAAAASAASAASSRGSQLQVSPFPSDQGDDHDSGEDQVSTEFEDDTDVEREAAPAGTAGIGIITTTGTLLSASPGNMNVNMNAEHTHRPRSRPRRRLSRAEASPSSTRVTTQEVPRRSNSKKATTPSASSSSKKGSVSGAGSAGSGAGSGAGAGGGGRRRTPYIEEYPSDEARRPLILLKEHKLPRRFSASDAKNLVTASAASVEEPTSVGSNTSRGRSPPGGLGRRLHGPKTPTTHAPATAAHKKKHRYEFQEAPGGKFSSSLERSTWTYITCRLTVEELGQENSLVRIWTLIRISPRIWL